MYTPRALFSHLPLVLFLYTIPYEISVQSPIIYVNSHYRVRGQSMVCVHTCDSDNALQR